MVKETPKNQRKSTESQTGKNPKNLKLAAKNPTETNFLLRFQVLVRIVVLMEQFRHEKRMDQVILHHA